MKEEMFVVGDIHGQFEMLVEILTYWDSNKQQLLFIGDLGDRGLNSKKCFLKAQELVEEEKKQFI